MPPAHAEHPPLVGLDALGPEPPALLGLVSRDEAAVGGDDPPPRELTVAGPEHAADRSGVPGMAGLERDLAVGDDLALGHGADDGVHGFGEGVVDLHPTIVARPPPEGSYDPGMRTLTDADADRHAAEIADQGYSVVEGAFDADCALRTLDRLDALVTELGIEPATNSFEGAKTYRVYNLLLHGELFEAIPVSPAVLPVVERVLDRECLLSSLSSIDIRPGETAQPIHADDQVIPLPKPHPPTVCNTMWALTDFTEANGATRLVPGSHLAREDPVYGQEYESVAGEMPAGSILVWHGSLWHGGGANQSAERRVGIASNYCAGFIRQQENQQLGVPREVAARFERRLQRLCGYGTYRGLIGHIDKTDPVTLLGDEPTHAMIWDAS